MRGSRVTLLAAETAPEGVRAFLAGSTSVDGASLTLAVEAGMLRGADRPMATTWQPRQCTFERLDDALVLTIEGTPFHWVRQGLGLGQTAQLDRGALTLADDRFLLVASRGDVHQAGTGTYFRRGTSFTLMPDWWLAHTPSGMNTDTPRMFDVAADKSVMTLPDGTSVPLLTPLNWRPPRAPRRQRQRPR